MCIYVAVQGQVCGLFCLYETGVRRQEVCCSGKMMKKHIRDSICLSDISAVVESKIR